MVLPIGKQQTSSSKQHNGTKSILDWYHKTSDIILDKVCCCSYLNAQVGIEEARTRTYYKTRPNDWLVEDDEVYDDGYYDYSSSSTTSLTSIGKKEARNPPHYTSSMKTKDYRFDLDDEWALLVSSSSSKETATTVLLADSNSTEDTFEEGEEYQESFFVASSSESSSYCGGGSTTTKFKDERNKYDKENASDYMMEQELPPTSRLVVDGCGERMTQYNFHLVDDDARDRTPIRSNLLPRFNNKTYHHGHEVNHPDRRPLYEDVYDDEDRRRRYCCRNNRGEGAVKMQSQQKMLGGYSRHVLREVQFEGRAKLPFLHATQGVEC